MPVRRSRLSQPSRSRSRTRRRIQHSSTTIGLIVFVVLCAGAYIIAAKNLGGMFADYFVLPSLAKKSAAGPKPTPRADALGIADAPLGTNGTDDAANASAPDASAASAASATPAPDTQTVRITLPELTAYAVQLGAYSTKEAAETAARDCIARSGAGYIVEDGKYRVLAAAYRTESEAKSVQQQLLSGQSIESYLYKLQASEATLNITASASTAEALKTSLPTIRSLIDEYGALALSLDAGEREVADVQILAAGIHDRAKEAAAPFERAKKGSEAVDSLASLFARTIAAAADASENTGTKVEVSSQIKYNYIDLLCAYVDTIDALSRVKASGA